MHNSMGLRMGNPVLRHHLPACLGPLNCSLRRAWTQPHLDAAAPPPDTPSFPTSLLPTNLVLLSHSALPPVHPPSLQEHRGCV